MKNKKLVGLFIVIIILILLVIFIRLSFRFELVGNKKINIKYGEEYTELGYKIKFLNRDLSDKVKVKSDVDTTKVGKYEVLYTYNHVTIKRTVYVTDEISPVITLNGEQEKNVCPDKNYDEEGYVAFDNYDGDIASKVKITTKDNEIIYSVEDSSGNKTEVTRKIIKKDEVAPEIVLKGNSVMSISLGSTYNEPGYSANDNCDGDLSSKVSVSGKVNNNKLGTYMIKYSVLDSAGNKTEVERKVIVVEKNNNYVGKIGVIYLTFDDGPSASGSTSKILNVLKSQGVKATFFVTGNGPDSLIKRAYDEGHTIALHTYSHDYKNIYSNVNNYFKDLYKVQERVERITGKKTYIFRFPGGTSNTISRNYNKGIMTELVVQTKEKGFKEFDWNVDASDAYKCAKSSVKNKEKCVYNNVVAGLSKNKANIVLMHDIKSYTAEALDDIIIYAKNNGYIFEAITEDTATYMFKPNN